METSAILKIVPGMKTKILSFMIPIVIVGGIIMIAMDHFSGAEDQEQNARKSGALLIAYCFFSLRSLHRYWIFLDLHPDKIIWTQGIKPLTKRYEISYSDIQSQSITALTGSLILHLSQANPQCRLPKELRLPPSFQIAEGQLATPNLENLEKEIGSARSTVRDTYYLKYEIAKRIASATR